MVRKREKGQLWRCRVDVSFIGKHRRGKGGNKIFMGFVRAPSKSKAKKACKRLTNLSVTAQKYSFVWKS